MSDSHPETRHLHALLDKFGEELEDNREDISTELSELLAGVDRDIYHLVNRETPHIENHEAIAERMHEVSVHFYADHPKISKLANELVVLIKRLGL